MRLLRLTTTDAQGRFDSDINESLSVGRDAEIAVQSLTVEFQPKTILVDPASSLVTWTITAAGGNRVASPPTKGIYNETSGPALLQAMGDWLNASVIPRLAVDPALPFGTNSEIGLQWRASLGKGGSAVIEWKRAILADYGDVPTERVLDNMTRSAGGVYSRNGGVVGQYDAFVAGTTPWCRGGSTCRMRLRGITVNGGVLFGLVANDPSGHVGPYAEGDIQFGVLIAPGDYEAIEAGTSTGSSGITPNVGPNTGLFGDVLEIWQGYDPDTNQRQIKVVLYVNGAAQPVELLAVDIGPAQTTYHPVLAFLGDTADQSVDALRSSADPYLSSLSSAPVVYDHGVAVAPPTQSQTQTKNNTLLVEAQLAEFLGFPASLQGPANATNSLQWIGGQRYGPATIPGTVVVRLDTPLDVESYDFGRTNKRQSIAAVCINVNQNDGMLVWQASPPVFLALRNKAGMLMRNIRAQLLSSDLTPIELQGESSLVLLLKD